MHKLAPIENHHFASFWLFYLLIDQNCLPVIYCSAWNSHKEFQLLKQIKNNHLHIQIIPWRTLAVIIIEQIEKIDLFCIHCVIAGITVWQGEIAGKWRQMGNWDRRKPEIWEPLSLNLFLIWTSLRLLMFLYFLKLENKATFVTFDVCIQCAWNQCCYFPNNPNSQVNHIKLLMRSFFCLKSLWIFVRMFCFLISFKMILFIWPASFISPILYKQNSMQKFSGVVPNMSDLFEFNHKQNLLATNN